ncbi:hypothetical protein [Oleiharenicola sp. Vm1]|uniref:hypothetical protein n=1 Tax=Oleiharenicola sp. Vm1 TaxID=3398393 RepID=UPI0039F5FD5B
MQPTKSNAVVCPACGAVTRVTRFGCWRKHHALSACSDGRSRLATPICILSGKPATSPAPHQRLAAALAALQAQAAAATELLSIRGKCPGHIRARLGSSQMRVSRYPEESRRIWDLLSSGRTRKTLRELTLADVKRLLG